jgi:hypothetical protein
MTRTDETEAVLRQAFMWGSLVSPLGASRVAARVGAERLFGAGVLGTGVVAIMVPAAWLTPSHVAIRIIQGIFVVFNLHFSRKTRGSYLCNISGGDFSCSAYASGDLDQTQARQRIRFFIHRSNILKRLFSDRFLSLYFCSR